MIKQKHGVTCSHVKFSTRNIQHLDQNESDYRSNDLTGKIYIYDDSGDRFYKF